jgi:hypothetical protein
VAVGAAVVRRSAWRDRAVRLLAGWTIVVWVVRSVGIANADHDGAFIAVHLVLAAISIALAVAALRETSRADVAVEARVDGR